MLCGHQLYVLLFCSLENSSSFSLISFFCFCHQPELIIIRTIPITINIILNIYGIQPAILSNAIVIKSGGAIFVLDRNKAIARCIIPNKIVPEINKTYPVFLIFSLHLNKQSLTKWPDSGTE